MEHDDPWDLYRFRRNVAIVAYAGICLVFFFVAPAVALFGVDVSEPLFLVLAIWLAWLMFVWTTNEGLRTFHCPRCGELYFVRGWRPFQLAILGPCRHCGLPKWSDSREMESENPPAE